MEESLCKDEGEGSVCREERRVGVRGRAVYRFLIY